GRGDAEDHAQPPHHHRHGARRHADGFRRYHRRRRHGRQPDSRAEHGHARVEDQLLRRLPLRGHPRRGDAAAQGPAHARLADPHHRRGRQAALAHHADPDDSVSGVVAAVLSSALGGSAAALTRYVIGATDSVTLAAYRFGIGFLLILPLALLLRSAFPKGRDGIWVALLGVLFFSIFFVFYNVAMSLTTAARGSLALSCLPLTTMLIAVVFRKETFTPRKIIGVAVAISGVALALWTGLADAPPGAWRGDLVMAGATVCM